MTNYSPRRWPGALAAVLGVGLLVPPAAYPQAIRVLMFLPTESGKLSRQVTRFDDALGTSASPLVRVRTLSEADAVVQFTGYRRVLDAKGESEDWWEGQFKLLTPPARDTRLAPAVSEHFMLLTIGRASWDAGAAVELLARTLARALGREYRPARDETVCHECYTRFIAAGDPIS